MLETLLTLIAPHNCLQCGVEGSLLCGSCTRQLPAAASCCYRCQRATENAKTCETCAMASPLQSVQARTTYTGVAKDLVWRLKFGRAKAAALDVARAISLPDAASGHVLLVHVPTATSRIRQRGYDQARVIARQFSKIQGIPYAPALVRHGQYRQVGASGDVRRAQLQSAFRVVLPRLVADKHIVLVDDVVTSGATLEAAARTLVQAGAHRIDATVFARA